MRKWMSWTLIGLLSLTVGTTTPLLAQTVCEVDLADTAAQVLRAQSAFSSGDGAGGVTQLAEVRAALDAVIATCAEAGVEPAVLLEQNFVAQNGVFRLKYPAGWIEGNFIQEIDGGLLFLGTSVEATSAMNSSIPILIPGDQTLAVIVATAESLDAPATSDALQVLQVYAQGVTDAYGVTPEYTSEEDDGVLTGRATFGNDNFSAAAASRALGNNGLFVVVIGLSAPGEIDALLPILDAVMDSVQ